MRPARARGVLRVARTTLAILVLGGGCEVLVDGKIHDVHCDDEGAVGPPACPVGSMCTRGTCVTATLGTVCTTDDDCGRGDFCLDASAFGGTGAPRCTRACCSSADCDPDPGFVCAIAPGSAGNVCRLASDVGRAEGGSEKPGASCDRDADCRSGRCSEGHCADTCCSDTGCSAYDHACRFGAGPAGEPNGFWCAPPDVKKERYATCASHDECASGLCIPLAPDPAPRCSVPCCDSSACELEPGKGTPVACAPTQVDGVWIRACSALVAGIAAGAVGSACNADGECRSGHCDAAQRCSDACCSDASCGDPSSFVCRPMREPSSWALRCTAK
ncbi:Hypothetical protein A7982_01844 [Minicystis rosea]|nr:Hypothetical protein A7982_01844 [Minicystis rosea]